jgi:hypothetical protein
MGKPWENHGKMVIYMERSSDPAFFVLWVNQLLVGGDWNMAFIYFYMTFHINWECHNPN